MKWTQPGQILLLVIVGSLVHLTHQRAATPTSLVFSAETDVFLPDGKVLRHFVMNQHTSVADLYWLKLLQVVGAPTGDPSDRIFRLADLITDLDPEYGYAYMAPSLVLGMHKRFDQANQLLEKGIDAGVKRWELPFYLGFNRWYEQSDFEGAARWLRLANEAPGRPSWLEVLIARLLSTAGNVNAAIDFVRAMAAEAPNEAVRRSYEEKLQQLFLERDLQRLEAGISAFKVTEGGLPWGLAELPSELLAQLTNPVDQFLYDPVEGKVQSPALKRRYKIDRPKDVKVVATPKE